MRKLCFIGGMGSGKSSLARRYTAKYGGTALDTDKEFVARYGEIHAFFDEFGEGEFRAREQKLMTEAAASDATVIATGGGAVLNKAGMNALRAACDIVYLTAPTDVLKSRIERSDRPLKAGIEDIMKARAPLYKKYADYTVDSSVDSLTELEKQLGSPRPNRYDIVLCDSDDTILDFNSACKQAVVGALGDLGITANIDEAIKIFRPLTERMWKSLERGEITRAQLFDERERLFGEAIGAKIERGAFTAAYRNNLRQTKCVRDGAIDFLDALRSRGIKVYIITNADAYCASERLKPLDGHIDGSFISEALGCNKPEREYFEKVLGGLGDIEVSRVIVFGDSETSDIAGGISVGLDTCLYDPSGVGEGTAADFRVGDYAEFLKIV